MHTTATGARRGDWMQTFTGVAFYPLDPRPEEADPADIAHALALTCRFGGHVRHFYSVAEHCVLMSHAVPAAHAAWALLHDAAEAYMGDLIRPVKYAIPDYRAGEQRLMRVICARFGIGADCPVAVKTADNQILRTERDALMTDPPRPWASTERVDPLNVHIQCWPPAEAERRFLARLGELGMMR